ncbi:META domain-containing protein [Nocardioides sp. W7]|uniref:META domain-containing protein n=1 Tax=Nocardioides sp. W7 TaxID=2931390 RepID=UPI001FD16B10|nr:META domain-containing protein [Nocardioides sp. W7]
MTRRIAPAVLLVAAMTLTGCGSENDSGSEPPVPVSVGDLDGTSYLSTEVTGRDLVAGTRVRLAFEDGVLSASAGCNTMFGEYAVTGETLAWTDPPASTAMGCVEDVAEQDRWLSALIEDGATARLVDGDLRLTQDDVILTLAPTTDVELPAALGRTWTVVQTVTGDSATSIPAGTRRPRLSVRSDGLARLFTGCNTGRTTVQVAEGALTFGTPAITRTACPEPAAGLERHVLAVLDGRSDLVTFDGSLLVVTKGDLGLVIEVG